MAPHHPAGVEMSLGHARIWYGPEVEGKRHLLTWTAFISAPLQPEELGKLAREILDECKVRHVFLTELFDDWKWFSMCLLPLCDFGGRRIPITVGRWASDGGRSIEGFFEQTFFPPARAELMVRAHERFRWLDLLRPTDQISVGRPYDLVAWTVGEGYRTSPEDYLKDKL